MVLLGDGDVPHDHRYEDLIAAGEEVVPDEPEEDDAALLMYTGGTTGLPKGVLLTQRNLILTAYHIGMTVRVEPDDRYLVQVPMFHAASMGAIIAMPTGGGRLVTVPVFDPAGVMAACEQHACTNTIMVPTMLAMTFAHPEYAPERMSSLQRLTYGASPMPRPVLERLRRRPARSCTVPGLRDDRERGAGQLPASRGPRARGQARLRRPAGAGHRRVDPDRGRRRRSPPGEVGEVCVRGGQFMREYWRRPEETAAAFRGGWYRSGDAGYLDADGYLFLVDRTKDMIVSGGENVYSTEVEQAVAAHPAVAQVAVIGVPHDALRRGRPRRRRAAPGARRPPSRSWSTTPAGLIAGYKVPRRWRSAASRCRCRGR